MSHLFSFCLYLNVLKFEGCPGLKSLGKWSARLYCRHRYRYTADTDTDTDTDTLQIQSVTDTVRCTMQIHCRYRLLYTADTGCCTLQTPTCIWTRSVSAVSGLEGEQFFRGFFSASHNHQHTWSGVERGGRGSLTVSGNMDLTKGRFQQQFFFLRGLGFRK